MFAYEKLTGLPRERVLSVVVPVLQAHGVRGVELSWTVDRHGPLLELTVEPEGAQGTRDSVSLDTCAEISRDLSTALDVAELIAGRYRLQVGSPGLDRKLYTVADYRRFAGQRARVRLNEPLRDQHVLDVLLEGVTEGGAIAGQYQGQPLELAFENIRSAQLIVDWERLGLSGGSPGARAPKRGPGPKARR